LSLWILNCIQTLRLFKQVYLTDWLTNSIVESLLRIWFLLSRTPDNGQSPKTQ
jgi:hypothetical protein